MTLVCRSFLLVCLITSVALGADPGGYNLPAASTNATTNAPANVPAAAVPINPMDQVATGDEITKALGDSAGPIVLFTESRYLPFRRLDGLPRSLLALPAGQRSAFHDQAQPGEFYVFQVAAYATKDAIGPLEFTSQGLPGPIRCINLGGVGPDGNPFRKSVMVESGHLVPLWMGIEVPADAKGSYAGTVTIRGGHDVSATASITLDISGDVMSDGGISDPLRLARLKWLDSTVGSEPTVTKPFVPMTIHGNQISILGRDVQIGEHGLPVRMISRFSASNTRLMEQGHDLLASGSDFIIDTGHGPIAWKSTAKPIEISDASADWQTVNTSDDIDMNVIGHMEFDGMIAIDIQVTPHRDLAVKDMDFAMPFNTDAVPYLMGLGEKGGRRPDKLQWKWNSDKFQDAVWLGNVNGGVLCRFKGENYRRPLVNIYYPFSPLNVPESWGTGGINVTPDGDARVALAAYTGPRQLVAGKTLHFKIEMYLTPFKLLDTDQHWSDRFVHPFEGSGQKVVDHVLTELKPAGPNIVEIHHATYTNPYINYPYNSDSLAALEKFVASVHELKSRLLVYYTTRELTTNLPELFALHSLNGEVIFPGPGADARTVVNPKGPDPWLVQHLRDSFIPAWRAHIGSPYNKPDLAVITTPDSRWNNFWFIRLLRSWSDKNAAARR
jgi:hypothetical protein